jgi:hypothetical protein
MAELKGFWSYVHKDDKAEGGRIIQLAQDLKEQYEMIACEEIDLFVDREDLRWGQAWREAIDLQLESVAFFIPIITPQFFRSSECRRELSTVASHAESYGVEDLILPIIYLYPQDFNDEDNEDVLVNLIKSLNWEDWTKNRFRNLDDGEYRKDVFRLANFLYEANIKSEQEIIDEIKHPEVIDEDIMESKLRDIEIDRIQDDDTDDALGVLDKLAISEEKLEQLPDILDSMTEDLHDLTNIMQQSTDDVKKSSAGGFGARLLIMKRTAKKLREPVENIWSKSNLYASHIHDVDVGYRILIKNAPMEIEDDPESKPKYCSLFDSIRYMFRESMGMVQSAKDLIEVFSPFEKQSRDMRPIVRRLKDGLTILIESTSVSKDWVDLIDDTGIECS